MPINKLVKNGKPVKDKNGVQAYRVRVNYQDMNGKSQQVERTAWGYSEAQLLEQQLVLKYKEQKEVAKSKMTVNDLISEYDRYHASETKQSSHDTAMKTLRLRVVPYLGDCRLDKLTQPKLAEWKLNLGALKLADQTKKNAYAAFVSLLNFATKLEYLPKNPLTLLGNFKDSNNIEQQPKKIRYYTVEQFQRYISFARKDCNTGIDWAYYVFFNIAFFTGCRKGEINALKWSDIEGNVLHIRRHITQKLKGGDVEGTPKTKSSVRDLQLPEPMMHILKEHKIRQQEAAGELFSENYLICGGTKPLRDTSIDKRNRKYADEAELPRITIHEFRHSHASLLANSGIEIMEIARRLGHSNVQETWRTYAHLYPSQEEKALEILNRIKVE